MAPHRAKQLTRQSGLTLVEVLLASVILALTASTVLTAMAAGHDASAKIAKHQQAHMLASNLMEEIKRFGNFENGDYAEDSLNGKSKEDDKKCAAARDCFDDKSDFGGYSDGAGVAAAGGNFVNHAGEALPLFTSGLPIPPMHRTVFTYANDLGGAIADFDIEQPALEVHVVVLDGSYGAGATEEIVRLRQIFISE
jgi:prepilin-type N-terminal cleavage/methylation domain-containing protein